MPELPPQSLTQYQKSFADHLRLPEQHALLPGIPANAGSIYGELLFNNICGFIDNCFPVAKSLTNKATWRQWCRIFYGSWPMQTPYFNEIPLAFVTFVEQSKRLPNAHAWLAELLHYEWVELKVATSPKHVNKGRALSISNTNVDELRLSLNPTAEIGAYQWPVHLISEGYEVTPQPTFLLVYRDSNNKVVFNELNAITTALLHSLYESPSSLPVTIEALARQSDNWDAKQLIEFAIPLVNDFLDKGILCLTQEEHSPPTKDSSLQR